MPQTYKTSLCSLSKQNERTLYPLVFLRVCVASYLVVRKDRQQVLRPLLGLNRYDGMKLCRAWCLPVYPDSTNEKIQFLRNRLRKQLLPLLRCIYNPQFDKQMFECSELFLRESLQIETILSKLYRTRIHSSCTDSCNDVPVVWLRKDDAHTAADRFPRAFAIIDEPHTSMRCFKERAKTCHYMFFPKVGSYTFLK